MKTFEYVVIIYEGTGKKAQIMVKPENLSVENIPNGDAFNFLGGQGFNLHTYTNVGNEIIYIFERVTDPTLEMMNQRITEDFARLPPTGSRFAIIPPGQDPDALDINEETAPDNIIRPFVPFGR